MVSVSKTQIFLAHRDGQEVYEKMRFWEALAIAFMSLFLLMAIAAVILEVPKHMGYFLEEMFRVPWWTQSAILALCVISAVLGIHSTMSALRIEAELVYKVDALAEVLGLDKEVLCKMPLTEVSGHAKSALFTQALRRDRAFGPDSTVESKRLVDLYELLWEFDLVEPADFHHAVEEARRKAS